MKTRVIIFVVIASLFLFLGLSHGSVENSFASSLPAGVSGAGVAYVNITNTITQQSQTSATSSVEYTFNYNGSGEINLTLPDYAADIKLFLTGQPYTFSEIPSSQCTTLNLSRTCTILEIPNVNSADIFTLSYSFTTSYTESSQFNSTFTFIAFSPTLLRTIIVLPSGAGLISYNPKYAVSNLTGNNKEVSWASFNTPGEWFFTVSYSASFPAPASQPATSYFIAGIVVIGIIIALIILMRSKHWSTVPAVSPKRLNPFIKLLNDDESKVLKMIKPGKSTAQKDLIAASGFSKSKMSKILSKLSRFRLIKLQSLGKTNKIKRI